MFGPSRERRGSLPQTRNKLYQRLMGEIAGTPFPDNPKKSGLPFLGETTEQKDTTNKNVATILENDEMLMTFSQRIGKSTEETKKILESYITKTVE